MKVLFERSDPDSKEAYYEIEEPDDHTEVGAVYANLKFVWDRRKSNDNYLEHNFSHYLTRIVYDDKNRLLSGTTIDIKVDDGNYGILCSFGSEHFSEKTSGLPEDAILLVRQEALNDDRIRLITCYATYNEYYVRAYWENWFERLRWGDKRPDSLDKADVPARVQEKYDKIHEINVKEINKIIDEVVQNSLAANRKFEEFVKAKRSFR